VDLRFVTVRYRVALAVCLPLPTTHDVREALQAVRSWVLPSHASTVVSLGLVVVMLGVLVWLAWRSRDEAGDVPRVLAVLAVCYLGSVLASKSLFDASTPLDQGILTPVHLLALVALTLLLALRLPEGPMLRGMVPAPAAVMALALVVVAVARGGSWVHDPAARTVGVRQSGMAQQSVGGRGQELDEPIFTNAADALYFEDGRASYALPQVTNPQSQLENQDLQPQLDEMKTFLQARRGLVVYFESVNWRPYLPTETALERDAGLHVLVREPDGVILGP
jgi:hypothetical protein